ncbi:MAG: hypothetical protein EGS42_04740 [Coprococcus eutactus]|nr:hypothetical protein [Coprococcus eutactus]
MRMIKDYRAITNGKYRLGCNVLIPVVLGIILALVDAVVRSCYVTVVMFGFGAAFMTAIEIVGDYWGFGAICVKGCLGMDYLKTSTKGKAMLQNALMADLLVRPVRIAICMAMVAVPYGIMVGNPVRPLCLSVLLTANLSVWALNITRYVQSVQVMSVLSMLAYGVSGAAVIYIATSHKMQRIEWPIVAALAVLMVVGIYVTLRHMYRKVEASYLDMD